jgi:hypothetical protein
MFGLELVHPGFLFAAGAAAIPVLVHLFLKQRAKRVEIGSLRFAMQLLREQNRIRKLKQWLLLALRVLAAILLAALFARPYWSESGTAAGEREVVMLFDDSASMSLWLPNDRPAWEQAWESLRGAVRALPEGTVAHVAAFDAHGVRKLELGELDAPRLFGDGATDYTIGLAWARDLLQRSPRARREIHLFTDLQRSGLRKSLPLELPPDIRVELHDVGQSLASNVAIVRAEAVRVEIRPQMPPAVVVDIRNDGLERRDKLRVVLDLTGPTDKLQLEQTIDLPPASSHRCTFALEAAKPGLYQGRATIECDDRLPLDNERFVALEARVPDRVLIVDGDEGASVFASETYFLETALQLGKEINAVDLATYETERIVWESGSGFPNLDGFRVIVLANVRRFSDTDLERLEQYVRSGGALLWFLGDRVEALQAERLTQAALMPAAIDRPSPAGTQRWGQWETTHPALAIFQDPQYGDLRRVQFRTVMQVQPADGANVLARTQNGWPLLVESQLGDGTILLYTVAADRDWGDWPQHRLYVPLVRQSVGYLTGQHERIASIEVATAGGPDDRPGVVTRRAVTRVVNVDSAESDLRRMSLDDLRAELDLPPDQVARERTAAELAALAPPPAAERSGELWPAIVLLLLLVLLVETLVAVRVTGA